ncbi:MAG: tetratricopeptide repeat protein [Acidobacteria bacterium]|nr:tetratricopeptide repeat protein [Acidobacteriota bacterium]
MRAGDVRICPACQARNKAKWEFCVRCGESLQGVEVDSGEAAVAPEAPAVEGPGLGSWLATLAVLGFLGAGAVFASRWAEKPPERPDPAIFAGPSTLAQMPPPSLEVRKPGRDRLADAIGMMDRGDFAGALKELSIALDEAPLDGTVHYYYAHALWTTGSIEEGVSHYVQAADLSRGEIGYQLQAARALARTNRRLEAVSRYEAALSLAPDHVEALRELAGLHFHAGNYRGAAPFLARAAEVSGSPVILSELAGSLANAGERDAALETYRRVLDRDPDNAASRGQLGELLVRNGRHDEAIGLIRAGIQRKPEVPGLHRDLASFLERVGRLAEAAREYREYARLAPNAPDSKRLVDRAAALEEQRSSAS